MPRLIIVDPILRGSRLHYTQLAARGLAADYDVIVLGRRGGVFERSAKYCGIFVLSDDFWYGRVGFFNFLRLAKFLMSLRRAEGDRLYFSGLNEWMPWFSIISLILAIKKIKTVAIDYEGKYWTDGKDSGQRQILGRLSRKVLTWIKELKVGVLDERLSLHSYCRTFFIPDPPVFNKRYVADKVKDVGSEGVRFLTFGVQSERKGIRLLEELVSKHAGILIKNNIFIRCVGALGDDAFDLEPSLRLASGNGCFEWIPEYISEERLEEEVSKVDFILLPYHPMFEGSSGVLAHACLWGRPVLASQHGVVGYRVKKFFIGDVFNYEISGFIEKIAGMNKEFVSSDRYMHGRSEFLGEFSEERHLNILGKELSEW
ncbi:hypothetical protein ACIGKL_21645 [Pseudomonas sp. NPDC077186]|uniref:hypothetical protein n=1 Tax=Pseudomonas sp. NPDC077186 TaxID=3364421 RepID=UPI0037CA0493